MISNTDVVVTNNTKTPMKKGDTVQFFSGRIKFIIEEIDYDLRERGEITSHWSSSNDTPLKDKSRPYLRLKFASGSNKGQWWLARVHPLDVHKVGESMPRPVDMDRLTAVSRMIARFRIGAKCKFTVDDDNYSRAGDVRTNTSRDWDYPIPQRQPTHVTIKHLDYRHGNVTGTYQKIDIDNKLSGKAIEIIFRPKLCSGRWHWTMFNDSGVIYGNYRRPWTRTSTEVTETLRTETELTKGIHK